MITPNQRLIGILSVIAILLLIPFVAMQFTSEVDWNLFDFVIMGILLLVTGLGIEFVLRIFKKTQQRIVFCLVILGAFFLIWAELAVGIFGTPFAGS